MVNAFKQQNSQPRLEYKNNKTLIANVAIFVVVLAFVLNNIMGDQTVIVVRVVLPLVLITCVSMWLSIRVEPGYVINENLDFKLLLEVFEPNLLCPECKIIKTPSSRHCTICH